MNKTNSALEPSLQNVDLKSINTYRSSPRKSFRFGSSSMFNRTNTHMPVEPQETIDAKKREAQKVKKYASYDSPYNLNSPKVYKSSPFKTTPTKSPSSSSIPEEEMEDSSLAVELFPSDTMIALQSLRTGFPEDLFRIPPIILRSQVYSVLEDRTTGDKELETYKQKNQIRFFELPSGGTDIALVFTEDYIAHTLAVRDKMKEDPKDETDYSIIDEFVDVILPQHTDMYCTKRTLNTILKRDITETEISTLVKVGVFRQKDIDTYWYAIPNVGSFVKKCIGGRKELLGIISRTKWKEILSTDVVKKKLRSSTLPALFHVKDLAGLGLLDTTQTSAGMLYKIPSQDRNPAKS